MLLAATAWVLIIYTAVPDSTFTPLGHRELYTASSLYRTLKVTVLSVGVLVSIWRMPLFALLLQRLNAFFVAFLVLIPLSYLWSISPTDTLGRYVGILTIVFACMAFCLARWHARRFQNVVRPIITLLLIGSVIFCLTSPDIAIEHGEGTLKDAWHGLTAQKNEFGQLGGFGLIFWCHGWLAREIKLWKFFAFGGLSALCLLLSRSSTSLFSTVFAVLLLIMLLRAPVSIRRFMPYLIALFSGTVLVYALAILDIVPGLSVLLEPFTSMSGKDLTFSNRSLIWQIIKEHIQLSPYFGTGYGAYWIGPVPSSPSYTFIGRLYFYPTESHNGYLEIVNDLGFAGLICLVGYLVAFVRQALALMKNDRVQAALYLGLFFQQAIMNLSESCWFSINSGFIFTIVAFATICMARGLLDQDLRGHLSRRRQTAPWRAY